MSEIEVQPAAEAAPRAPVCPSGSALRTPSPRRRRPLKTSSAATGAGGCRFSSWSWSATFLCRRHVQDRHAAGGGEPDSSQSKVGRAMAQAPPEQREMGNEDLPVHHGGHLYRQSDPGAGWCLPSCRSVCGAPSTSCFGGKATFGSIFAVWMYASLPSIIKTLLGTVVIFAGRRRSRSTSRTLRPPTSAPF